MSKTLKESETLKNLMRAFAGESQARNRYTFAAGLCKTQQLHVLEAIFTFTANQGSVRVLEKNGFRLAETLVEDGTASGYYTKSIVSQY